MHTRRRARRSGLGSVIARVATALVVVAIAVAYTAAPAGAATSPWSSSLLAPEYAMRQFDNAVDRSGAVHIASTRDGSGSGVWYHARQPDGTYSSERISATPDAWGVAIAIDPAGRPVVAYGVGDRLLIAGRTGGGWHEQLVSMASGYDAGIDLAIDAKGHRHVAFAGDGVARYGTDTSGTWRVERVGSLPYQTTAVSVAVDSAGVVHVAFQRGTDGRSVVLSGSIGNWTTKAFGPAFDPYESVPLTNPSLAVDPAGDIHVAWVDITRFPEGIRHAWLHKGTWTSERVPVDTSVGYGEVDTPMLAFRDGRPVVAFLIDRAYIAVTELGVDGRWRQHVVDGHYSSAAPGLFVLPDGDLEVVFDGVSCLSCMVLDDWRGIGAEIEHGGGWQFRSLVHDAIRPEAVLARGPSGATEVLMRTADEALSLYREPNGAWASTSVASSRHAWDIDMAIGPAGEHDMVWVQGWPNLVILQTDRGGVMTRRRIGAGTNPRVAVDAAGTVHVVYEEGALGDGTPSPLRYVRVQGTEVTTEAIPHSAAERTWAFAVSQDGIPHIAWEQWKAAPYDTTVPAGVHQAWRTADGAWHVKHLTHSTASWEGVGGMGVDSNGTTWIQVVQTFGVELLRVRDGALWTTNAPVDFWSSRFALDELGRPTLVGPDWNGDGKEASLGSGGWTVRPFPDGWKLWPVEVLVSGGRTTVLAERHGFNGELIAGAGWYMVEGPR